MGKSVGVWGEVRRDVGRGMGILGGSVLGVGEVMGDVGKCGRRYGEPQHTSSLTFPHLPQTPTHFPYLHLHFPTHFLTPSTITPYTLPSLLHTCPHIFSYLPPHPNTLPYTHPHISPSLFLQPNTLSHTSLHISPHLSPHFSTSSQDRN